jgi:hypothetical protein
MVMIVFVLEEIRSGNANTLGGTSLPELWYMRAELYRTSGHEKLAEK